MAYLTFRVIAHTDTRTRFVVEYSNRPQDHCMSIVLTSQTAACRFRFSVDSTSVECLFTRPCFQVDVRERTLEPGEEVPLTIKVQLDELIRFRDQLNILVVEGADTTVPLEALGVGSVVTCDEVDEQGMAVQVDPRLTLG